MSVLNPVKQIWHIVAPSDDEYVPWGQNWHSLLFEASKIVEKVPAMHLVQTVAHPVE
jgi:hypothetical protein